MLPPNLLNVPVKHYHVTIRDLRAAPSYVVVVTDRYAPSRRIAEHMALDDFETKHPDCLDRLTDTHCVERITEIAEKPTPLDNQPGACC